MSFLLKGDHLSYFIEGGTTEAIPSMPGDYFVVRSSLLVMTPYIMGFSFSDYLLIHSLLFQGVIEEDSVLSRVQEKMESPLKLFFTLIVFSFQIFYPLTSFP